VTKAAEYRQVGRQVRSTGVIGQHHGRLRQVRQTGERETGILEHTQVGHGDKVVVATDIKGRLWVDAPPHVVDDDVVAFALLEVVKHVAQLQARLQGCRIQRQQ